MAARLGRVLYWLGCIIGAVVVLVVVAVAFINPGLAEDRGIIVGLGIVLGAISWGIGRALRYILAGE
jgi:hypothetical protein